MRHGKKFNHLSRQTGHRSAMLANMATSLILHKRIRTTKAKAKALRTFVEPLITRAKEDTTHNRRMAFRYLRDKEAIKELFNEVSQKVAERPGGYTRIVKLDFRPGDNAEMAMIELVDYNDLMLAEKTEKKGGRKRSRRGSKKSSDAPKTEAKKEQPKKEEAPKEEKTAAAVEVEEAPVEAPAADVTEELVEEAQAETPDAAEAVAETQEATEEAKEEVTEAAEEAEETPEEPKAEEGGDDAEEEEKKD